MGNKPRTSPRGSSRWPDGLLVAPANINAAFQVVCVLNQAPAPPQAATVSPVQLAEEASARQPWPNLQLNVNPGVGLAGLATWFWCAAARPCLTRRRVRAA